jgi:sensor c-di-GMP phosphodiesterase-like protein
MIPLILRNSATRQAILFYKNAHTWTKDLVFPFKIVYVLEATSFHHVTELSFLSRNTRLRCSYWVRCEEVRFLMKNLQTQYKALFTYVSHTAFLKQNSPQVAMEFRLLKIPLKLSCFTNVWARNETTLEMFLTFSFLS